MNNKKMKEKSSPDENEKFQITDESMQILLKEYDTLKDFFGQTENIIQGIFNFYITFFTAFVGGIALILQLSATNVNISIRSQLLISGLLFLAALIGTIFMLSLTGRYARLIQYGRGLDALRLYLIQNFKVPLPSIYNQFLAHKEKLSNVPNSVIWIAWLQPVGTHQFAMAFINSLALSISTWLLFSAAGVTTIRFGDSLAVIVVEFLLVLNIYNIYSRVMIRRWQSNLSLHINPQYSHPFQMLR